MSTFSQRVRKGSGMMNLSMRISFVLFLGISLWIVGCATNPAEGWTLLFSSDKHMGSIIPGEPLHQQYKAMIDDYQAYIKDAKLKHPGWWLLTVKIYEDESGRHAVKLTVNTDMREDTDFYLMYDTSNVRTKVIRGETRHHFHI